MFKSLYSILRGLLVCLGLAYALHASADDAVCSTASLVNPALVNASPVNPAVDGGIGGTGAPTEHKGIGGTGAPVANGGFGGTGDTMKADALLPQQIDGDVVVIGVITGFASICVNGVEVHYDNLTPIYDNGQQAKLADLAVGKTVMLKADKTAGRLVAKAVGMFHAVAGPIDHIDLKRGQMQVLGQVVRLDAQAMQHAKELLPGVHVRISGHRIESGEVMATRIDKDTGTSAANTLGVVTQVHADGFSVNNTRVKVMDKQQLANIKAGTEIHVSGPVEKGVLLARQIELQPTRNVLTKAKILFAEGYAYSGEKGLANISGTQLAVRYDGEDNKLEQLKGKIVKIEAKRNDKGEWASDAIEQRKGEMFERHSEHLDRGGEADNNSGKNGSKSDLDEKHENDNNRSGSQHGSGSGSGHDDSSNRHGGGRDDSGRHINHSETKPERPHRSDSKDPGKRDSHGGKNK